MVTLHLDDIEFVLSDGQFLFTTEDSMLYTCVDVVATDDLLVEAPETAMVLINTSSLMPSDLALGYDQVNVTIMDNDGMILHRHYTN